MPAPIIGLVPAASRPRWWWWAAIALGTAIMLSVPQYADLAALFNISVILLLAILALSMSFLWGFCGMLSFGQTAFFGLGGYTYAVLSLNFGETTGAFVAALIVPALFAAAVGYFMIYGRISGMYFAVITLVVTLMLDKGIRATSGVQYVIGDVRLNGQNGIPGIPSIQVPWNPDVTLFLDGVYYLCLVFLILVYIGLRLVLVTQFGRVLIGIRENERRVELLGYDTRIYKLLAFVLAGAVAGLAGALYAVWNNFVAPEMFNLSQAAQVVVWVMVGGKSTLIGPIFGTAVVVYLANRLGIANVGQVTVVLGAVLMILVLVLPQGLVPSVGLVLGCCRDWLGRRLGGGRKT